MKRSKKIGLFRISDIWFDTDCFKGTNSRITLLHTNNYLEEEFYDYKIVEKTLVLNIEIKIEDLMQKFDAKSCRYPIRKAVKDGVNVIRAKSETEYETYLSFENDFCKQKNIPGVSRNDLNDLDVYYAISPSGEYLGGCAFIVSESDELVRYKYGATLHKFNANEIILWKAICDYREQGIKYFDFGGVIPTDDKNSYYYRHYHFKKKFGGELVDSYIYCKIPGIYRPIYLMSNLILKIMFKGNLNEAINWLNRRGFVS